jgi:hypothetical protein
MQYDTVCFFKMELSEYTWKLSRVLSVQIQGVRVNGINPELHPFELI